MAVRKWLCFDGSKHPVSVEFLAKVTPDLESLSYTALKNELARLQAISAVDLLDGRRDLDDGERQRVEAIVHVLNLNRALAFLEGRDYREVFGARATLDQVHGNAVEKDCGCVLQVMFDHNKRDRAEVEIHPHHSLKVCGKHEIFKGDFQAHHKVFEE